MKTILKTLLFLLLLSGACRQNPANTFIIAPEGNDNNAGTKNSPFATLEAARDAIRNLKAHDGLPEGGVQVYLREGTYKLPSSFKLNEDDSGSENAPITYAGYENEEVLLTGSFELPNEAFSKLSDENILERLKPEIRDEILQIDLQAQGIEDYGELEAYGMNLPAVVPAPELFFNGEAMTLARYPNEGYLRIESVMDPGSRPRDWEFPENHSNYVPPDERGPLRGATFKYPGNRPSRWQDTGNIWMFGFWWFDWADGTLQVESIDTVKKTLKTVQPSHYGVRANQRYYYFNILEEIDSPGEWYLDREEGILYLYPPGDLANADIELSMLDEDLITLEGADYINIENLKLGITRANGISVYGGSNNTIAGCSIFRTGQKAVIISGKEDGNEEDSGELGPGNVGTNNRVVSCDIFETGAGGIVLAGGDRKTLTPGNNQAINNHIHHYERIRKTYTPAISLHGVGNRTAHNHIHDAPHFAISYSGNEHIMEYNEIHHVVEESSDAGAIYNGRNPTEAGNIIRYNYFHHIGNDLGGYGQQSIFLDDGACFHHIYGNVFYQAGSNAVFKVHGGQHNIFEHNIIVDSPPVGAFHLWGDNWDDWLRGEYHPHGIEEKLSAVNFDQPPYSERYPKLATILEDGVPRKSNVIRENLILNSEILEEGSDDATLENNFVTNENPGFVDRAGGNFQLRDNAIIFEKVPDFPKIPFDSIGLYEDAFRKIQ